MRNTWPRWGSLGESLTMTWSPMMSRFIACRPVGLKPQRTILPVSRRTRKRPLGLTSMTVPLWSMLAWLWPFTVALTLVLCFRSPGCSSFVSQPHHHSTGDSAICTSVPTSVSVPLTTGSRGITRDRPHFRSRGLRAFSRSLRVASLPHQCAGANPWLDNAGGAPRSSHRIDRGEL